MKIGKIIKIVLVSCLLILFGFLLFRICMLDDTRTLREIHPTEGAIAAYEEKGADAFSTHRIADEIAKDGFFGSYSLVYIENESEAQITARYNDSLYEKYLVGSSAEDYEWELRNADGDVLSYGKILETAEKYQYNYVKLSFEGITFGEEDVFLFLVCPSCEYPKDDNEGQLIHASTMKFGKYKLSKDEIKELEK